MANEARGARRASAVLGALGALVLGAAALAPGAATAGATEPKVALPHSVPTLPANAKVVGAPSSDQVMNLDVVLAGQNPGGLAQEAVAVSTPGSPVYHHYLTAAQYAAEFGPTASEVAQVSSALRAEGLTVGQPEAGSTLLPVGGTAAAVSSALGTTLQTVQVSNEGPAVVNTTPAQIPASLAGSITAVAGLNGLLRQHSMLKTRSHSDPVPGTGPGTGTGTGTATGTGAATGSHQGAAVPAPSGSSGSAEGSASGSTGGSVSGSTGGAQSHTETAHFGNPSCAAAASAAAKPQNVGSYTSTQLASVYGLDQLFGQGRIGIGQTIAVVEFERYLSTDYNNFTACYGVTNPIHNIPVDGGATGPAAGQGEAALDVELAAVNAPGASINVYEAPNNNDAQALDMFNRIASDDTAQVMTTSWGNCEKTIQMNDNPYFGLEKGIFDRMALQGQTMIAASGDSGSEDCFFPPDSTDATLNVDDPGSQPDFLSAGGTTLPSADESSQTVWNSCQGALPTCALGANPLMPPDGAGGGGVSSYVPTPAFQASLPNPPAKRAVPDFSYTSDPNTGAVMAYWSGQWIPFGGTSVAAPVNAGLFADTNQGCYASLGALAPNLYANANSSTFFDVQSGNNDYTDTNSGQFGAGAGFDKASGLGTPHDDTLAIALQGADGCPAVNSVSPNTGPISGSGAITVTGGGFANATQVVFGSAGAGHIVSQSETSLTVVPPDAPQAMCVDVTVVNSQGVSAKWSGDEYGFGGDLNCGQGYRFVASDGGIFTYGSASFWGSAGGMPINAPVVGMAGTPSTNGYWLVATDGGIFSYGDAHFFGSMGGQPLNKPIVGIASTPNGGGYWEVATDGGIFSFGNAQFYGSTGSMQLNKPIVGMAATPDGHGYWLVASDGGIFSYGDAQFFGSTGSIALNRPIVGMAAGPGGNGYWLIASDGGIFTYGSAQYYGSMGGKPLNQPIVGMTTTPDQAGYWEVASDGGIFTFGNAQFFGSTGSIHLNKPIVGMSST